MTSTGALDSMGMESYFGNSVANFAKTAPLRFANFGHGSVRSFRVSERPSERVTEVLKWGTQRCALTAPLANSAGATSTGGCLPKNTGRPRKAATTTDPAARRNAAE
jgi:hypothetical protein